MHDKVVGWDAFATVAGGAAGALIGLIVVAVSIRVEVISRSTDLRNRAAQTLGLFTTVLLVAVAVAIPDQERGVVGVEMIITAAVAAATLVFLDRRAKGERAELPISGVLDVIAPRNAHMPPARRRWRRVDIRIGSRLVHHGDGDGCSKHRRDRKCLAVPDTRRELTYPRARAPSKRRCSGKDRNWPAPSCRSGAA
jgi:hypothetical protein